MTITGNTILITGGGSGIGRALAEQLQKLGNQVIIAGRREEILAETAAANPGIQSLTLDIENADSIKAFAKEIAEKFPQLNVLINNAGVMKMEDLHPSKHDLEIAEQIIGINLLGPIRLTSALLPLLQKQPKSTVMMVSSGLAFVPMASTPTYCATKAAIHSYTQSLRYQLKGTTTEVLELIPPYVQTDLMNGKADPRAMPLNDFIAEVISILKTQPDVVEICVEKVKPLRFAAESGHYDKVFNGLNEAMSKPH